MKKCVLLILILFLTTLSLYSDENQKQEDIPDISEEDYEIIENMEILETFELLEYIDVLEDFEVIKGEEVDEVNN